jgi:Icc-related predicted phosphoesterase
MVKITFISDTHNKHDQVQTGCGDILIHCGDFTKKGSLEDVTSFAHFMKKQQFKYKIVIAGNHDFCFEDERKSAAEALLREHEIMYLNDSGVQIEGMNIWGSPIQPEFYDWAFNRQRGADIKKHWDLIPGDTDILLTHGPPWGILDRCVSGAHAGCEDLLKVVKRIRPKIHAFGHIHEAYGQKETDGTHFINACMLNLRYQHIYRPIDVALAL